jgi:hypothetical protein
MEIAMLVAKVQIITRKWTKLVCQTLALSLPLVWLVSANRAQSEAAAPEQQLPDVTVIAPRPPTPQELAGHAVPDFIRVHAKPAAITGQLARWNLGICPITQGLSPGFNDFVSARMLAIAEKVGAPHQEGERCKSRHNVYIFFTTEPEKVLDSLEKQDSKILGIHSRGEAKDLKMTSGPIQGWYITASRGARGDQSIDEANPLLPLAPVGANLEQGKHPAGLPGSRLSSALSSSIVNAVIVADINKLVGHEIGPISDYIAMLTLTQVFAPDRCGTLPSIMDLMTPNCGGTEKPSGITAGDLAFLRGLYRMDIEAVFSLERSSIADAMNRQLNERPQDAN